MRTSRYSTSRQKACQQCSASKAKCKRQDDGCARCIQRGLACSYGATDVGRRTGRQAIAVGNDLYTPEMLPNPPTGVVHSTTDILDFTDLELTCPINADDIANRWLNTYVPIPGQVVKEYHPSISRFIYQILKAYAGSAVRSRGAPPFVHASQLTSAAWGGSPLATCLSVVRICSRPLPGSEAAAAEILQREMVKIHDSHTMYGDKALLAAFQAYLIYAMVLFFRLGEASDPFLRQAMINLQELACATSREGLVCLAEQQNARPRWEAWIVAEAKRRTLYTMYLFDSVLSSQDGLPTFLGTELQGLPGPASKSNWQASTRREWEAEYNAYLAETTDGTLRIDDLWPAPPGLDEPGIAARHNRVDQWLEDLDEFGTLMYTIVQSAKQKLALETEGEPGSPDSPEQAPLPPAAPREPYSIFDRRQKAVIVLIVSTAATFSGFASNIYFPALPEIARDLDVSVELVNLTVTTYLIFQAIAPSVWGPISDVKGRRVAYVCTFLVFLGACIGLAETKNYATLVVLRGLQSTGSASTIAIGSGVIGDITTRESRGGYMGIFQAGLLVPVAAGPVIGGALAGSLGWRSIFWFLAIYCGVFLLALILLLPETLRSIVANGARSPSNLLAKHPLSFYQRTTKVKHDTEQPPPKAASKKHIDATGPFRILVSKHAAPIIVFLAVYYAVWQMSITAMSSLFEERYHLSEAEIGLTFIANGAGSIIGTLITGKILDVDYRRVKAKQQRLSSQLSVEMGQGLPSDCEDDKFPLEQARLRLIPIFSLLQCAAIALFGWTVQYSSRVHIAVPIVSTFVTGWTAVSTQSLVMTYLVDIFPDRSGAASASLNLARCLLAAGGTSFVLPMVNAIGAGWAFTACVGVQVVALAGAGVQWKFAGTWRAEAERNARQKAQRLAGREAQDD
ncbi:MFS general substrate transporter [Thozetella sp. PMI_491]|nr:MFS general substrate transporter [Thozetella sp. PMI_491]